MPLRRYLELLLGSKVKINVLRALWQHRNKEFTIRELASYLGLSHAGVRKALDDLEKANAVSVRTVGKSHVVSIRPDSYAGRIIEDIFTFESGTLGDLKAMLKEVLEVPEVISAALFGSVVREEENPLSDLDLFVVTDQKGRAEEIIADLQKEIVRRFGNALSPYYLSEREYEQKRNTPLVRGILRNHVLICGRELG